MYNYYPSYNYYPYAYNAPYAAQPPVHAWPHPMWPQWGYGSYDYGNGYRPWDMGPQSGYPYPWLYNRPHYGMYNPYGYGRHGQGEYWPGYAAQPFYGYAGPPRGWNEYRPAPGQEYMVAA